MTLGNGVIERAGESLGDGEMLGAPPKNQIASSWEGDDPPKNQIASSQEGDDLQKIKLHHPGRMTTSKKSNRSILGGW